MISAWYTMKGNAQRWYYSLEELLSIIYTCILFTKHIK